MKQKIKDLTINYLHTGSGKETLIFLHGWGQTYDSFLPTIETLKNDYEIYALDLPGFGESQVPNEPIDIYEYVEILKEFIAKNEITNPTIIGHSFGGRMGIIYAALNSNIDKLILTGAAGIKPRRTRTYRFKVYHYKFMKLLCKTPFYFQYFEDLTANSGSDDYRNANEIMKQVLIKVVNEDLTNLLEIIDTPTLLFWGSHDEATPIEDGFKMSEKIKNSELYISKDKGHFAFLEDNITFNSKVKEFLEKDMKNIVK